MNKEGAKFLNLMVGFFLFIAISLHQLHAPLSMMVCSS